MLASEVADQVKTASGLFDRIGTSGMTDLAVLMFTKVAVEKGADVCELLLALEETAEMLDEVLGYRYAAEAAGCPSEALDMLEAPLALAAITRKTMADYGVELV
jgi:hypothetical protein